MKKLSGSPRIVWSYLCSPLDEIVDYRSLHPGITAEKNENFLIRNTKLVFYSATHLIIFINFYT